MKTPDVADTLMSPLGLLLGKMVFAGLFINLSGVDYPTIKAAQDAEGGHNKLWHFHQYDH